MYHHNYSLICSNLYKLQHSSLDKRTNAFIHICFRYRSFKSSLKNLSKSQLKKNENLVSSLSKKNKHEPSQIVGLIKPTVFTILFSSASFVGATIWQYESMRTYALGLVSSPKNWIKTKIIPADFWTRDKFNVTVNLKQGSVRQICNKWWNSLQEGQKIFFPILFINTLICIAWRFPAFQPTLLRYFCSNTIPNGKILCWPMVLSVFSHQNPIHLACNMVVLNSFINSIVNTLGKEQFLAFYLSAGTTSSLMSLIYRNITAQQASSLGASGAIMGILGYTCFKFPNTLLSIIFVPFLVFKASTGIKAILAVDFVGLLMKWKFFDHAAHLGGGLFGLFWCYWGNLYIWQNRGPLLEWWHDHRSRFH